MTRFHDDSDDRNAKVGGWSVFLLCAGIVVALLLGWPEW